MTYHIAPLACRPWTLNGLSARLIESHYEHNYGEAVQRLNGIREEIATLAAQASRPAVIHRLKRDELELLNSTLLHELYFASLGGDGRSVPALMEAALTRDFGSVDGWRRQFVELARALAGRSGWVTLVYVPRDGQLINQTAGEHGQAISGGIPILALDLYEHVYHLEFGANADAYVAAFMRNIDWAGVQARYEDAVKVLAPRTPEQTEFADVPSISPEEVRSLLAAGAPLHVVDVRPKHYVTRSNEIVAGAVWRDPERVGEWVGELPRDQPVVTFCVYGFHIGCETAAALREAGIDARYMSGGHAAWKALKGPVQLSE